MKKLQNFIATSTVVSLGLVFLVGSPCKGDGCNPKKDTIAPVIKIIGNNPVVVEKSTNYTDGGATVTDNVDNNVTLITTGAVDTSTAGTYTLTYDATDKAGNKAISKTRTVVVKKDFKNPLTLKSLTYGELAGRAGHKGIRPLLKKPVAGTVYLMITTSGDVASLTVKINPNIANEQSYTAETPDSVIKNNPQDTNDDIKKWIIKTEIPTEESLILVTMITPSNQPYSAAIQKIVTSSTGIALSRSDMDFSLGPNTVIASISNYGEKASFLVSATDNYQLVKKQFNSQTITIDKGKSKTVDIPLNLLAKDIEKDIYDYKISVTVKNTASKEENTDKMDINIIKAPTIVSDRYKSVVINPSNCSPISKNSGTVEVIIAGSDKLFLDKVDFDSIIFMNGEIKPISTELLDKVSFNNPICGNPKGDGSIDLVMTFSLQDIISAYPYNGVSRKFPAYIDFYNIDGLSSDIVDFTIEVGE